MTIPIESETSREVDCEDICGDFPHLSCCLRFQPGTAPNRPLFKILDLEHLRFFAFILNFAPEASALLTSPAVSKLGIFLQKIIMRGRSL